MTTKEQYEKFFDQIDTDHSGSLDKKELTKLMKDNGFTDKDATEFMRVADASGDGKMSKAEFLEAMDCIPEDQKAEAQMRRLFRLVDVDGNGSIDRKELKTVFDEMGGDPMSDKDLDAIMKHIDVSGDGKIPYEEFIKAYKTK